jgi:hypothetical protein
MKTELRLTPHSILPGRTVIELWYDGQLIGTIAGANGPGVRVVTKDTIKAKAAPDDGSGINLLEVGITPAPSRPA